MRKPWKSYDWDLFGWYELEEEVEGLLQNVSEIDILINAAGYGLMKDYNEFSDYEVVKMFDTML